MNADNNYNHVMSGVDGDVLKVGFEDLTGGGDGDFNDLTISIEYNASDEPGEIATSDSFSFIAMDDEDDDSETISENDGSDGGYSVTDGGEATFNIAVDQPL